MLAPDAPLRFDEAAAKRAFGSRHRALMRRFQETYPSHIFAGVADMRVFALDVASPRVAELLRAFCAENRKRVKGALNENSVNDRKLIKGHLQFKHFSYHDCEVVSCRKRGRDIVMKLDRSVKLIFHNAAVIRADARPYGKDWI